MSDRKPWTIRHLEETQPGRVRRARTGSRAAAMALKCMDCTGCQRDLVKNCPVRTCPLWPWRNGTFDPDHGLPIPEKDPEKVERMRARMAALHE